MPVNNFKLLELKKTLFISSLGVCYLCLPVGTTWDFLRVLGSVPATLGYPQVTQGGWDQATPAPSRFEVGKRPPTKELGNIEK